MKYICNILAVLSFWAMNCFAQEDTKRAFYTSLDSGLCEMFVFMSSGDFIYRSGTTYGWSRAEGHGTYVINEEMKEIKLTGMQVASLIKGTDLRNDSVSGSEIHFYKFDDNSGVYESGMWAKYIIINKDTIYWTDVNTDTIYNKHSSNKDYKILQYPFPTSIKYNDSIDSVEVFIPPNAVIKYKKSNPQSNVIDLFFQFDGIDLSEKYMSNDVLHIDDLQCFVYKNKFFCKWPDSDSVFTIMQKK